MSPSTAPVIPGAPAEPSARSTPPKALGPAARPLTIVAIADDPALLDAIVRAGRDRDVVITSPTADRFVDQLVANVAAIAVVDAACAPQPLEQFIERIHAQFPQLLLILAGSAPLQAAFAPRLVDGTLFRFAHKPASAQRMQLFVDAARRHLEAATPDADRASGGPPIEQDTARSARPWGAVLTGSLLLVALLGLGWWRLSPDSATPAATVPARAAHAAPPVTTAPIAPIAPIETPADDPLASAVQARAAAMIASLGAMPPVIAAMPPGPFLELARARLASHDLIAPAGDSALFYVEAAQALTPEDPEVGATALALGEAVVAQTRQALNARDPEAARTWLRACTEYRINQNTIDELAARLQQLEDAAPPAGSPAP